jgi:protein-S-isoprenylcysteine O-methyltransferase Ste14
MKPNRIKGLADLGNVAEMQVRATIEMKEEKTDKPQWKPTWKDLVFSSVGGILFIGQIVLCFLFYNWAGLNVLLYLGWIILAVAIVLGWRARVSFEEKGEAQEGESWLRTSVVVDSGVYAVVRHPIYLSFMLLILALMLISQHWLSVIFGLPIVVFLYLGMRVEEQSNIKRFGDDYIRYIQGVPRINFVAGIIRLLVRRRNRA